MTRGRAIVQGLASGTLLILLWTSPGLAADGVLEINQACAASGCFAGDAPGFPVTIDRDQTGSYRLTSNLINLDPDVSAIQILDDHVTLDLNGFAISGPVTCTGSGVNISCGALGQGVGVEVYPGRSRTGVVVRNGTVRGMASSGIKLGDSARVEGVHAVSNAGLGITVAKRSLVTRCRVARNGLDGIGTNGESVIRGNVVFGNGWFAVLGSPSSVVSGNAIRENAISGHATHDSLMVDNAVTDNGTSVTSSSRMGYARNTLRGNGTGAQVSGGGVEIGPNLCGTDTTCP